MPSDPQGSYRLDPFITFSHDYKLVASASADESINPTSSEKWLQALRAHFNMLWDVALATA
ncbi:unnamed protein product [Penicillium pancosmium]